ncbi:hypothetical protein SKA58_05210 [Sphingomonas sp. SKA58]|nr:hypothetical protein SKA58_05210 [Sphingomonas sp. SKA58]
MAIALVTRLPVDPEVAEMSANADTML